MTLERFEALLRVTGPIAPEGLEEHIADLECSEKCLLPRDALQETLDRSHVPAHQQAMLFHALDAAEGVPELVELSRIMAKDAVRALVRCTACEFEAPKPKCLEGFDREAFAFLYTQLCVLEGRKALRERGVPEKYDMDIPERMTRKQLSKFVSTGDISFDDYPWDMNFYCCQIFLLDRFYFIPFLWEGPPYPFREEGTGRVIALWKGGARVRRDGQLDGVNGVSDPGAFETVYLENDREITGNIVSPEGIILRDTATLDKKRWKRALCDGDYLLALHIPGGIGYTPERVKLSCETALGFYQRYYSEYDYKGFWSESWLYDPGLKRLLGPERNIIRVQRQYYCYPTMEGDEMTRVEVLHDARADYRKREPATSLERALFAAWDRGERCHCTGMFLLKEEVSRIGQDPYLKEG